MLNIRTGFNIFFMANILSFPDLLHICVIKHLFGEYSLGIASLFLPWLVLKGHIPVSEILVFLSKLSLLKG
jgi:hypothetical protein